jgi:hypothetical protein
MCGETLCPYFELNSGDKNIMQCIVAMDSAVCKVSHEIQTKTEKYFTPLECK